MSVPNLGGVAKYFSSLKKGWKVTQSVSHGIVTKTGTPIELNGNLQPTPTRLMQDSAREWSNAEWMFIVQENKASLHYDDIISFDDKMFQVKVIEDWSSAKFVRYGLTETCASNIHKEDAA